MPRNDITAAGPAALPPNGPYDGETEVARHERLLAKDTRTGDVGDRIPPRARWKRPMERPAACTPDGDGGNLLRAVRAGYYRGMSRTGHSAVNAH